MKIAAISDLHGFLPHVPRADVLVIAGDIMGDDYSLGFSPSTAQQMYWLKNEFSDWLRDTPVDHIIGIGGNHDFALMRTNIGSELPWTYLHDESVEIDGVIFHGSPYVPTFGGWAFMEPDQDLTRHWDKIPENVDVLVVHGPPYGILDQTSAKWGSEHVGSTTLANKVIYHLPNLKLMVFGHIHPAYGVEDHNGTIYANVSYVDDNYEPVRSVQVFNIESGLDK